MTHSNASRGTRRPARTLSAVAMYLLLLHAAGCGGGPSAAEIEEATSAGHSVFLWSDGRRQTVPGSGTAKVSVKYKRLDSELPESAAMVVRFTATATQSGGGMTSTTTKTLEYYDDVNSIRGQDEGTVECEMSFSGDSYAGEGEVTVYVADKRGRGAAAISNRVTIPVLFEK